MKKKNLLLAIAMIICSFGFSQNEKYQVKVFIGSTLCKDTLTLSRSQIINAAKLTIVVGNDTINKMSYTMQMMKSDYLTPMFPISSCYFPDNVMQLLRPNDGDLKVKKLWIEKITIEYKGETRKLMSLAINIKD